MSNMYGPAHVILVCIVNEVCMGFLGIQDIGHFTSRDMVYSSFYFQGYMILCSITGILFLLSFFFKIKNPEKKTSIK